MSWHILVGYGFSLAVGAFFTSIISSSLWKGIGWTGRGDSFRPYPHHPAMLGVCPSNRTNKEISVKRQA